YRTYGTPLECSKSLRYWFLRSCGGIHTNRESQSVLRDEKQCPFPLLVFLQNPDLRCFPQLLAEHLSSLLAESPDCPMSRVRYIESLPLHGNRYPEELRKDGSR